MKVNIAKLSGCILFAMFGTFVIHAQDSIKESDKEVIIIERVVDEDGNEISKKITKRQGDVTDEELEELSSGAKPWSWRENWPFSEDGSGMERFRSLFGQNNSNPTLGLKLLFEQEGAQVTEVVPGSGADEAEVREGDVLISINGVAIASIEDVKEVIGEKKEGDKVSVKIVRDGVEYDKEVELKINNFGPLSFTMPDGGGQGQFFFDFDGEQGSWFNLDSMQQFWGDQDFGQMFRELFRDMPDFHPGEEKEYGDKVESERPSMGVFIEDGDEGVLITEVIKDSPADQAGLQSGDEIFEVNGSTIRSYDELVDLLYDRKKGDVLEVLVKRNNKKKKIAVTLE
jgi:predicted metalloprotease with PDZ domain